MSFTPQEQLEIQVSLHRLVIFQKTTMLHFFLSFLILLLLPQYFLSIHYFFEQMKHFQVFGKFDLNQIKACQYSIQGKQFWVFKLNKG